jgi:hypothetical protein
MWMLEQVWPFEISFKLVPHWWVIFDHAFLCCTNLGVCEKSCHCLLLKNIIHRTFRMWKTLQVIAIRIGNKPFCFMVMTNSCDVSYWICKKIYSWKRCVYHGGCKLNHWGEQKGEWRVEAGSKHEPSFSYNLFVSNYYN